MAEITKRFLREGRIWIQVDPPINGNKCIKNSLFVWLQGNPSFTFIPKGYVVHHLDGNELNDDISNLALMFGKHHMAYHYKNKTLQTMVLLSDDARVKPIRTVFFPRKKPGFFKVKGRKSERWRVWFNERLSGESKKIFLSAWEGQPIINREMAEWVANIIWAEKGNENGLKRMTNQETYKNDDLNIPVISMS